MKFTEEDDEDSKGKLNIWNRSVVIHSISMDKVSLLSKPLKKASGKTKVSAPLESVEDPMDLGTMLIIKFPREPRFPSTSELRAKFARFKRFADASAAYDQFLKNGNFYETKVSCCLQGSEISFSNLPEKAFNKVLLLSFSSSGEGAIGSDKRGNDSRMDNAVKSLRTILSTAWPPLVPVHAYILSHEALSQFAELSKTATASNCQNEQTTAN